jgi:hypothetical protein
LECKHESLKQSLKESHESETKTKKELEDKHAQAMAEMAKKLKTSNNRIKSLSTELKATEAEAADIDELIFRKDFTFMAYTLYAFLFLNPEPERVIFFCKYQRVSDLNGERIPDFPGLKPMKKPGTQLMISSKLAVPLPRSCP